MGELLRQEISGMVQELPDPRLGFVTITGVRLSEDLMEAKVFFSVFGENEERKVTSEILAEAVPSLRQRLGRKLESLKKVPAIHFIYDETPEKAQRVTELLNRIADERREREKQKQDANPLPMGKRSPTLAQEVKTKNVCCAAKRKTSRCRTKR